MGKGGAGKVEVTEYFMSVHFGICAQADKLKRIVIKEKTAWSGELSTLSSISISQRGLFGGNKKEGGVDGKIYFLPGNDDQILPDELAQRLGRSGGADAPGYRGIASLWFVGPGYRGRPGFYWTANQPYLPGVWAEIERAPVGLNPAYAMVPLSAQTISTSNSWRYFTAPYEDNTFYGAPDFDDSAWDIGESPFGDRTHPFADNAGWEPTPATVIEGGQQIWIRQSNVSPLFTQLRFFADNIGTLYYNGVEVPSTRTYGWAPGPGGEYIATVPPELVQASNTIAIRVQDIGAAGGTNYIYAGFTIETSTLNAADANGAHIIYECLTNTDWGMGSPAAANDLPSFEAAALTLYNESFGLSMIWTRQSSIESFVQEVLDHIQGVLFVDPATGLMNLKLIRGDYDEATLPEISPANAKLSGFGRKLWGEITNEIVVTWTNPENEQDETITVQDLASIVTQGGIISDGRNYYGVRNASLAARLAARDLRTSGAPLATCEASVDRLLWDIRPASVLKVTWPEYGLAGLVMRVMNVDYGKPGQPEIKLSLLEDVFGLDAGDYVEPPSSSFIDPASQPAPLGETQIFTLPRFLAVNSGADLSGVAYPELQAGVLGTTSDSDTFNYELWDEVALPDGSLVWESLATMAVIGRGELLVALDPEASSDVVSFGALTGQTAPSQGGFAIIGDGSEEGSEIALVTGIGASFTIARGVLDTVPRSWPVGTPVYFVDGAASFEDPVIRSAGEVVSYKMLTRTSLGQLALGSAPLESYTLTERPYLPNRPANVTVDGEAFGTADAPVDATDRADPWLTVTWSIRNRLLEDSIVLLWNGASTAPEAGQTTKIEVLKADGTTVLATHAELAGDSFDVPDASLGGEALVIIRVSSERTDADGTFESLQALDVFVQISAATFDTTSTTFDSTSATWDSD